MSILPRGRLMPSSPLIISMEVDERRIEQESDTSSICQMVFCHKDPEGNGQSDKMIMIP